MPPAGRAPLIALAAALALASSGCALLPVPAAGPAPGPQREETPVTEPFSTPEGALVLPAASAEVELRPGQHLVIDVGQVNASIGEHWSLEREPDRAVLAVLGQDTRFADDPPMPGSPARVRMLFQAVVPGTTEMLLQYLFRNEPPEQPPVRIGITVR